MGGDVEQGAKTFSVTDGEEDADTTADFIASHLVEASLSTGDGSKHSVSARVGVPQTEQAPLTV